MGYGYKIPANQLGKCKNLWVLREYGLYLVCVRRETVPNHMSVIMWSPKGRPKVRWKTIVFFPTVIV